MELRVGNRYRLGRKIGSGSFGDIYLGEAPLPPSPGGPPDRRPPGPSPPGAGSRTPPDPAPRTRGRRGDPLRASSSPRPGDPAPAPGIPSPGCGCDRDPPALPRPARAPVAPRVGVGRRELFGPSVGSGPCPGGTCPDMRPWPPGSGPEPRPETLAGRRGPPVSAPGCPRRQTKASGRVCGPLRPVHVGGGHGESPGRRPEAPATRGALCDSAARARQLPWVWTSGHWTAGPSAGSPGWVGPSAWSSRPGVYVAHLGRSRGGIQVTPDEVVVAMLAK